jgi:hypothetical protein
MREAESGLSHGILGALSLKKALFLLLLVPVTVLAGFSIRLKAVSGENSIQAEIRQKRILVDLIETIEGLGGDIYLRDGEYVLVFSSGTAVINPQTGVYRVRPKGKKKWKAAGLEQAPLYSGPRLLVGMEDLPALTFRTFTYHLQRKELTEDNAVPLVKEASNRRRIPARHVTSGQKEWISLEDAARALGVVLYSSQPKRYGFVMPDFTVQEVAVGEPWVYRKKQRYKPLEDPILLFSGIPHATLPTLSLLFDADIQWDRTKRELLLPVHYGRLKSIIVPEKRPLTIIGILPRPLRASMDELSIYYQEPGPTYASDHPNVYNSVSDYLTHRPLNPHTHGYDRMGGETLLKLTGTMMGQPLEGGGRFEKVGTRSRTINGDLQWGFPRFQVQVAREYVKMAGFFGQFDLIDQISISHSNDSFGEGRTNPSWGIKALYGRQDFSIFVSTELFSQTVGFRQTMAGGTFEGGWRSGSGQLNASLTSFRFFNQIRQISADYNPFLIDFLDFLQPIDQGEARTLASSALTDRHDTTVLDTSYRIENVGRLEAAGGLSEYHDQAGAPVMDDDWRASLTIGDKRSRLTGGYEQVGPRFRSMGSPQNYQDRRITRISPYIDLGRVWKLSGEFRREDFGAVDQPNLLPYRSDFVYFSNAFYFPSFDFRLSANKWDHSLYGKSWSSGVDSTRFLGADSLELGASWASQWYPGLNGELYLFRQSYIGRGGYQIVRKAWKFSAGEELTRHHYPFYKSALWRNVSPQFPDRWESSTHLLGQWGNWEGTVQYNFEPRHYRERETLHTGYARIGYQLQEKKIFNLFYAVTALNPGLGSPQVWRAGLEFVNDFF